MNQEQFKIDGIVTVPEGTGLEMFEKWFLNRYYGTEITWRGTISPLNPDAESFMVEVERKVLQGYKKTIADYEEAVANYKRAFVANDKVFADLAEQLRQEKEESKRLDEDNDKFRSDNSSLQKYIAALELRLKVKDSPIKAGLKRIWKWFKGLVGK